MFLKSEGLSDFVILICEVFHYFALKYLQNLNVGNVAWVNWLESRDWSLINNIENTSSWYDGFNFVTHLYIPFHHISLWTRMEGDKRWGQSIRQFASKFVIRIIVIKAISSARFSKFISTLRSSSTKEPERRLSMKTVFPDIGIYIIKVRRSLDSLIVIMGIPNLVRRHFYAETVPRSRGSNEMWL